MEMKKKKKNMEMKNVATEMKNMEMKKKHGDEKCSYRGNANHSTHKFVVKTTVFIAQNE